MKGGPQPRVSSPLPGRSSFRTSAPRSPSICPQKGPASTREASSTRTLASGPAASLGIIGLGLSGDIIGLAYCRDHRVRQVARPPPTSDRPTLARVNFFPYLGQVRTPSGNIIVETSLSTCPSLELFDVWPISGPRPSQPPGTLDDGRLRRHSFGPLCSGDAEQL